MHEMGTRFLVVVVAIKQALISAAGRAPKSHNGGTEVGEATKFASPSDHLPFQDATNSYKNLQYESHTPDPINIPNTWDSDPVAFIELHPELKPRQAEGPTTYASTCGYLNGNASLPRVAMRGYDCRVDTKNAIWGFCLTINTAVSDCGLVGGCVDAHACRSGCGISGDPTISTYTCTSGADYCTTGLLTNGPNQTYTYLGCGDAALTENYLKSPTVTPLHSSTSSIALSGAKASVTTASSTSSATSSTPYSTSPTTFIISTTSLIYSAPVSSSTLSNASANLSNNTGAIVGGVLGGSALLAFVVMAIVFDQRLRRHRTNGAHPFDPLWQDIGSQNVIPRKARSQALRLAELSSHTNPTELSSSRRDETTELPNDMGGTRRS